MVCVYIVLEAPLLWSVTNSGHKAESVFHLKTDSQAAAGEAQRQPCDVTALQAGYSFLGCCSDMFNQAPSHAVIPLPKTSRRRVRIHSWSFCCLC